MNNLFGQLFTSLIVLEWVLYLSFLYDLLLFLFEESSIVENDLSELEYILVFKVKKSYFYAVLQ